MLRVDSLVKDFKHSRAVDGVSLHIEQDEIVGLLGSNGAGKSTTFRMIIGMLKPNAGRVEFLDEDVSQWPMYRRCRAGMGYLAQEPTIFRDLTVEQNLLAILEQLALSRRERWRRCEQLLDEFGLQRIRKDVSARKSGGEKRRLEIARALIMEPRLILLDEPFAGVDPIATGEIGEMIRGLKQRGIAVLLTDHDVASTLKTTNRAYIMDKGKLLFAGTPEQVVADPLCRQVYLGDDFELKLPAASPSPPRAEPREDLNT